MTATNKELVSRFVREYQIGDDRRVLLDSVDPDMVNRTPMIPGLTGLAEVEAIAGSARRLPARRPVLVPPTRRRPS